MLYISYLLVPYEGRFEHSLNHAGKSAKYYTFRERHIDHNHADQ